MRVQIFYNARMHIHQLSASYEAAHDRILLRINTHEGQVMQLWFTRRFLRQLFPKLSEYERSLTLGNLAQASPEKTSGHSLEAQEELLTIQREAFLQGSDFATPFAQPTQAPELPALLITQVTFERQTGQQIGLHFQEVLPDSQQNRGLRLNFSAEVYVGLLSLLQQTVRLAEWTDIEFGAAGVPEPPTPPATDDGVHLW
jgi:hypothetical protein